VEAEDMLLQALSGTVADSPDAIRIGERMMSREALAGAATALAERIAGAPTVAITATTGLETIVGVVAGLLAGVPVVPVPPDAGPVERDHILRDSGAVLMTGERTWEDVELPYVPVSLTATSAASLPEPDPEAAALILYTSGTTGMPKGVIISQRAMAADLDALAEAWQWTADDVLVHGLPLFHIHGLILGVLGGLRIGSRLLHTVRPTPAGYAAAGGTLYFGVPTVWSRICDDPASATALSSARLLVSGSAPLPLPVFTRIAELTGHQMVERYGMTETLITLSPRADQPRRAGYVGFPLAGVHTRLADEDGQPVPDDGESIGGLQVRGPTLFNGYLGLPEVTAACFTADGWFRTGDMATIDPDGWHRIVGRASTDLIKSGGYRIGAGEVEAVLSLHPAVREAAVVGVPDSDLGQAIVAYVVADDVTDQQLIDFVATRLSVHKRPRRVVLLDRLPRNAMGKIQKNLLVS
jgi:fatty acid CoA ligase FadD36